MTLDVLTDYLLNYGVLGLTSAGLVTGLIVPKWAYTREVKRADTAHDLLKLQQDTIDRLARGLKP